MSRKKIEFEYETEDFGKKQIVVYEISVKKLYKKLQKKAEESNGEVKLIDLMSLFKHCCSLPIEEFEQLYPSEQKFLFNKFKEVNSDFFLMWPNVTDALKKLGIKEFVINILNQLNIQDLIKTKILEVWNSQFEPESSGSLNSDM